jgi:hypothetical protein
VDVEDSHFTVALVEQSVEYLKELINIISTERTLWLMPRGRTGARQIRVAQFLGFARTLRPQVGILLFTLELSEQEMISSASLVLDVLGNVQIESDEGTLATDMEYSIVDSHVLVPRYLPMTLNGDMERVSDRLTSLDGTANSPQKHRKGLLQTLCWQEPPHTSCVPNDHVEIDIRAAGWNVYNILCAKGIINSEITPEYSGFGCEASGVIRRVGGGIDSYSVGDRVMVITNDGSLSTSTIVPDKLVFRIPVCITFSEAAKVPVCSGNVLYS